jgi:hypothetical protein
MTGGPGDWASPGGTPPGGTPSGSDRPSPDPTGLTSGQPAHEQPAATTPFSYAAPRVGEVSPKPGVVPLRPLGAGELLDGALTTVRRYPRATVLPAAVLAVAQTLAIFAVQVSLLHRVSNNNVSDGEAAAEVLGLLLVYAVTSLATVLLAAMCAAVVREGVLGKPMDLRGAWAAVSPHAGRVIAAAVLSTLGWVLASVTIVGGVYLYVAWRFATVVIVIEGGGARAALRRSRTIVRGAWWRTFGLLLLVALVSGVVAAVIQVPFDFAGSGTSLFTGSNDLSTGALAVRDIGQVLSTTITAPFVACAHALIYVDRRMRSEGLDVALRRAADPRP